MPRKNDYVNYGNQGICKIEDIRPMNLVLIPANGNITF